MSNRLPRAAWSDAAYIYASTKADKARLTGQRRLDLTKRASLERLPPLDNLPQVQRLQVWGTKIEDISEIGRLTGLIDVNLSSTRVRDISPLRNLQHLTHLAFARTAVTDIAPLAGLTALQALNLHTTEVSDLRPLVGLTGLIDGAIADKQKGLEFANCPITDKKLRELAKIPNPERTIKAINYLREQQGLPPYDPKQADALPDALRDDPLGASARVEGDHVVLALDSNDLPEEDENETAQAHKEIIRKARTLKEDCCGLGNYPGWKRLEETAGLFLEEIDRPFSELGKRSVTLWSLSVSLGSFLEQNREAQNDTASLTSRLEPNVSRALGDLVVTTANFVRIFETPRKYDAGLVDMQTTPAATEAARQITNRAGDEDVLRRADVQILSSVLNSTAADGVHTRKAHGFGLKSVRNIVVTTLAFIWGGGIKKACENHVENSALTKKLTDFMDRSEEDVLTVYEDAAPDIREAVREVLARRRDDK